MIRVSAGQKQGQTSINLAGALRSKMAAVTCIEGKALVRKPRGKVDSENGFLETRNAIEGGDCRSKDYMANAT